MASVIRLDSPDSFRPRFRRRPGCAACGLSGARGLGGLGAVSANAVSDLKKALNRLGRALGDGEIRVAGGNDSKAHDRLPTWERFDCQLAEAGQGWQTLRSLIRATNRLGEDLVRLGGNVIQKFRGEQKKILDVIGLVGGGASLGAICSGLAESESAQNRILKFIASHSGELAKAVNAVARALEGGGGGTLRARAQGSAGTVQQPTVVTTPDASLRPSSSPKKKKKLSPVVTIGIPAVAAGAGLLLLTR